MAQIDISYDTKDKTCSVTIDGKKQSDISSVTIDKGYDENSGYITMTKIKTNEEEKMYERTTIYASHEETILEPIVDTAALSEKISHRMKNRLYYK